MTTQLNLLYELTMRLTECISEATVDELLDLVELRDDVIESMKLKGDLADAEKSLLAQISANDAIIVSRMTALKEEAVQQLDKIAKIRIQKQTYEKVYAGDSYFFDQKE